MEIYREKIESKKRTMKLACEKIEWELITKLNDAVTRVIRERHEAVARALRERDDVFARILQEKAFRSATS